MVVTQFYSTEHFGVATQHFKRRVPGLNCGRAPLTISDGNGTVVVIPENADVLFRVGHDRFLPSSSHFIIPCTSIFDNT
jgi:hypothetical protein